MRRRRVGRRASVGRVAYTVFFAPEGEQGARWPDLPDGWHLRGRFHVKRTLRGRHRLPYSLSGHDKARQVGPVPLAVRVKRGSRRWR